MNEHLLALEFTFLPLHHTTLKNKQNKTYNKQKEQGNDCSRSQSSNLFRGRQGIEMRRGRCWDLPVAPFTTWVVVTREFTDTYLLNCVCVSYTTSSFEGGR